MAGAGEAFLVARVLFDGVLAFMALNHFTNIDQMVPYAVGAGLFWPPTQRDPMTTRESAVSGRPTLGGGVVR